MSVCQKTQVQHFGEEMKKIKNRDSAKHDTKWAYWRGQEHAHEKSLVAAKPEGKEGSDGPRVLEFSMDDHCT